MFILTQDCRTIINASKISSITVQGKSIYANEVLNDQTNYQLIGSFDTTQRAMEELEKIFKSMK